MLTSFLDVKVERIHTTGIHIPNSRFPGSFICNWHCHLPSTAVENAVPSRIEFNFLFQYGNKSVEQQAFNCYATARPLWYKVHYLTYGTSAARTHGYKYHYRIQPTSTYSLCSTGW